ncbi:kinesin-like protein KIN-12B isoform X1 [Phoenix dactylifera]|uniref:Kinesin-like protein KIN-12B isoform X1 n=1 Tax=Phoenix dactylifera TaxID=42345 RepID=A0A8B9AGQ9_PHODC|nr:kinesin-like protein KIN-12B isoform X1 [Phoenix dactylifera]
MKAPLPPRSGRAPPSETLTPSKQRPPRVPKENVDPNSMPQESSPFRSPAASAKPLAARSRSPLPPRPPSSPASNPSGNSLKRKLNLDTLPENGAPVMVPSDSGVQVIVRMRPPNEEEEEGDRIVQKISSDSISILDHVFTFDSVADTTATQQDIFHLVGFPLVENCLAGFNSSIFAYGQTGSGKTYTMWGPPSALSDDGSLDDQRGLTPRVFERLFLRIKEEQAKHSEKQLVYQCRCSFLEIYNEQITDLLDPSQKHLQIREDVRTGVYVEHLTEEYVFTVKDVIQLLIKGLANRRTGATSINVESSRSHCVFTCVVESRSKVTSYCWAVTRTSAKSMADGSSSLRTSRINLVDLAGSERQKLTGAAGDRLKEAGNINRSLSQLGNLINILAEVSQSGKQRHIPYRDSKLSFLLQESLGGNAKLAMICAISPSHSCKSETFSTLRFAQRAKSIKNKAVINETTQDDVNALREQIRQLKDELLRMKSNGTCAESNGGYSNGWNARRSLSLLRLSLKCPTALPIIEGDSDEEMEIDEDDVEKVCIQAYTLPSSCEENRSDLQRSYNQLEHLKKVKSHNDNEMDQEHISLKDLPVPDYGSDQVSNLIDIKVEGCELDKNVAEEVAGCDLEKTTNGPVFSKSYTQEHCYTDNVDTISELRDNKALDDGSLVDKTCEMVLDLPDNSIPREGEPLKEMSSACQDIAAGEDSTVVSLADSTNSSSSSPDSIMLSSLSVVPCQTSPVLQPPAFSISARTENYSRKSLRTSSSVSASEKSLSLYTKSDSGLDLSFADGLNNPPNACLIWPTHSSPKSTKRLAVSLCRGLQMFDSHHGGSSLRQSLFRFSKQPVDFKRLLPIIKVNIGTQTLPQESDISEDSLIYICSYCKNKAPLEHDDVNEGMNLQLIPTDGSKTAGKCIKQVPKVVEKVLTGAIRREMALEDLCAKQAVEIVQLNRLVEQYKHERECNAVIEQTREDKISRLEGLMDGILPVEDFMEEEFISLMNEHKLLKQKYENNPEVLRVNIELKRVLGELDGYRNFFDLGERDVLMEEIQDLRNQLQYYTDSSSSSNQNRSPLPKLTYASEPISAFHCTKTDLTKESADEKFEQERRHWTETESKWISISEELRLDLEASRSLAEKLKHELDSERKCTQELKEALQTAMQGHARILEQYADLQEKHMALLGRHRKISDGIADVKRAAAKAGVKGAESKFINSLAAEISALKVGREKERQYWRDENKGLQAQLRDTAEAVQAAGELLVRLKEAEEAAAIAQKRAFVAEEETKKAYEEIHNLKKNHEREICTLNQFLSESRLPKEALRSAFAGADVAKYDGGESLSDQRWKEEFEPFLQDRDNDFSRGNEPTYTWHSGYDRCNI